MKFDKRQMIFDGFGLEDDVQLEAEARQISAEEARQISETARQMFEQGAQVLGKNEEGEVEFATTWYGEYLMLREWCWPWRVATYIAWAASPKRGREPRTLNELADKVLGLTSPRAVHMWREKNPTIDAVVSMMQAQPMLEHRRDVIEALIKSATGGDYKSHSDRKLFLEMTGDYVPRVKIDERIGKALDLSELSDEELDARGAKRVIEERVKRAGREDPTPNPSPNSINLERGTSSQTAPTDDGGE